MTVEVRLQGRDKGLISTWIGNLIFIGRRGYGWGERWWKCTLINKGVVTMWNNWGNRWKDLLRPTNGRSETRFCRLDPMDEIPGTLWKEKAYKSFLRTDTFWKNREDGEGRGLDGLTSAVCFSSFGGIGSSFDSSITGGGGCNRRLFSSLSAFVKNISGMCIMSFSFGAGRFWEDGGMSSSFARSQIVIVSSFVFFGCGTLWNQIKTQFPTSLTFCLFPAEATSSFTFFSRCCRGRNRGQTLRDACFWVDSFYILQEDTIYTVVEGFVPWHAGLAWFEQSDVSISIISTSIPFNSQQNVWQ